VRTERRESANIRRNESSLALSCSVWLLLLFNKEIMMKRFLALVLSAALCAAFCYGEGLKLGGHAAYLVESDAEDDIFGYGGQIGTRVNDTFSLELSVSVFKDDSEEIERDISTTALSGRLGALLGEGLHVYFGGGGNYTKCDVDYSGADVDDEFGYHFCGGFDLAIHEGLELFAEYRHSFVDFEEGDQPEEFQNAFDGEYEFALVRVGLNFLL